MSDRGSILISTANDIGEALVEKLGGEGYAPAVWDKEYNKLGIAEVDAAPALSVLEDSSETGTARGSILMSTANAIGAMLNKKYNTDRGFKPKEWASAGRKMKALETDTKSGSIVNIQGAKETPLLSLVGTIDPTIEGTSEVNAYKLGKNLLNASANSYTFNVGDNYRFNCGTLSLKKGVTYTFSANQQDALTSNTRNTLCIGVNEVYTYENASATNYHNQSGAHSMQYTPNEDCEAVFLVWVHTPSNAVTYSNFMVEVGSSASTYEPYKNPTTYTADLGETVYGGNVDFISGVGKKTYAKVDLGSLTWVKVTSNVEAPYFSTTEAISPLYNYQNGNPNVIGNNGYTYAPIGSTGTSDGFYIIASSYVRIRDANYSSMTAQEFKTAIAGTYLVYERVTPEDFTFDAQEINASGDVENYYTSAGDTSIEYYAVPTPYTRGTASGAIANVQSARTDLPFTMVKANIAPNLTGVESVEVTKCGVNLFDKTAITPNTWIIVNSTSTEASNSYSTSDYIPVSAGKRYFVSFKDSNRSAYYDRNKNGIEYFSFNGNASFTALYDGYIRVTIKNDINLDTFIINEGNDEATYEQYNKTTYTADLGRTVYGGTADIVNGTGSETYTKVKLSDLTWTQGTAGGREYYNAVIATAETTNTHDIVTDLPYSGMVTVANMTDKSIAKWQQSVRIYDTDITSVSQLLETYGDEYIAYPNRYTTDFSFDGQVVRVSPGVNNLWNNAGGDTDVEYFTTE